MGQSKLAFPTGLKLIMADNLPLGFLPLVALVPISPSSFGRSSGKIQQVAE